MDQMTQHWRIQPHPHPDRTRPDMIYININNQETTMLEFIGLTAIVYLFLMGVVRLFRGNPPTHEIYIIREYEIQEETDESESVEPLSGENKPRAMREKLPDNVVPLRRKR